jgi:putative oxidoreductase-like protein
VPRELFARVTGEPDFPVALGHLVAGDRLVYMSNAELTFRCGDVLVHASTRWELSAPAGGGDTHRARLRGTRADIHVEQNAGTGWRRRLTVEPRPGAATVEEALQRWTATVQGIVPGLAIGPAENGWEVLIPSALRTGHESHFPLVLDEFVGHVERAEWPASRAASTLAKYEVLAQARELSETGGAGKDAMSGLRRA